jgi:hypothetical protein
MKTKFDINIYPIRKKDVSSAFVVNDLRFALFPKDNAITASIIEGWQYESYMFEFLYRNHIKTSGKDIIDVGANNGNFAVELPGKMVYATDRDILVDAIDNKMKFLVEKKNHFGEYILAKTEGLDVHVMNKYSLDRVITGDTNV